MRTFSHLFALLVAIICFYDCSVSGANVSDALTYAAQISPSYAQTDKENWLSCRYYLSLRNYRRRRMVLTVSLRVTCTWNDPRFISRNVYNVWGPKIFMRGVKFDNHYFTSYAFGSFRFSYQIIIYEAQCRKSKQSSRRGQLNCDAGTLIQSDPTVPMNFQKANFSYSVRKEVEQFVKYQYYNTTISGDYLNQLSLTVTIETTPSQHDYWRIEFPAFLSLLLMMLQCILLPVGSSHRNILAIINIFLTYTQLLNMLWEEGGTLSSGRNTYLHYIYYCLCLWNTIHFLCTQLAIQCWIMNPSQFIIDFADLCLSSLPTCLTPGSYDLTLLEENGAVAQRKNESVWLAFLQLIDWLFALSALIFFTVLFCL